MKIFSDPTSVVPFKCEKCGITGEANVSTDFRGIRWNGETIISIVCPNCGNHQETDSPIPDHIKPYIRIEVRGWSHED